MSVAHDSLTLDDLYYMVAHIYSEQNADRSRTDTFAHFVEVCSLLTTWQTHKPRGDVDMEGALCKALAWYFPLAAKLRIKSLESAILRKYPGVCPYCQRAPHIPDKCNSRMEPNFDELRARYGKMQAPKSLNDWQRMFNEIYPREAQTRKSLMGLFEELGELAEALRFYDRYPNYALGEMADVFSYIVGLANEYSASEKAWSFDFQGRFLDEYPGVCPACNEPVCACVGLPDRARVAKEVPIDEIARDLVPHPHSFDEIWDLREKNVIGTVMPAGKELTVTRKGMFFAGQQFEALQQVQKILTESDRSIDLIDGYIDENVLRLLTAKRDGVGVRILTKKTPPAVKVAAGAFNKQYGDLAIRESGAFHDRFVVIDGQVLYHFGASIKDAGNKGFMFSLIEEADLVKALIDKFQEAWGNAPEIVSSTARA